jgi:hypothetical protein
MPQFLGSKFLPTLPGWKASGVPAAPKAYGQSTDPDERQAINDAARLAAPPTYPTNQSTTVPRYNYLTNQSTAPTLPSANPVAPVTAPPTDTTTARPHGGGGGGGTPTSPGTITPFPRIAGVPVDYGVPGVPVYYTDALWNLFGGNPEALYYQFRGSNAQLLSDYKNLENLWLQGTGRYLMPENLRAIMEPATAVAKAAAAASGRQPTMTDVLNYVQQQLLTKAPNPPNIGYLKLGSI